MKRMPNGWTPEMDATLLRVFPEGGSEAVAKLVGRSYSSVQMRAYRLGIQMHRRGKRPGGNALTDRLEREIAQAGLSGLSQAEFMARHPDDNRRSVVTTAGRLVDDGRAFAVGYHAWRRWFSTAEAASQYEGTVRPPTYQERLRAERAERKAKRVAAAPAPKVAPVVRGPAVSDGPVSYHPDFKFTRVPAPPASLRTNTYSNY